MSFEYYIAKRIHFQQGRKNISRPAVRIATIAIALGLAVMIIALSVVLGFKQQIRNKTIGFGGHIQVTNYDSNNTFEMNPISVDSSFLRSLNSIAGVKHIESFATKPGIIKNETDFQGIVLKGVGSDFDWNFFKSNLIEGEILHISKDSLQNNIIISKYLAKLLGLKLGDSFFTYFIQNQVRARKFTITGIYSTNFIEYDKLFIISDIRHVQQLNGWSDKQYSGLELFIDNFDYLDIVSDAVYDLVSVQKTEDKPIYYSQNIKQISPQIFGWLDLLDLNVWVILFLMLAVAGFNMISGLLILILERTSMIGVLKSLGANNWSIRKIFLYHSVFLIGKGMFWGNIIGLIFCALQYFTGIIPLDAEAYYVSTVPIMFNWTYIIVLNIGTALASVLMMIGPSYLITKILPAKIIRYE